MQFFYISEKAGVLGELIHMIIEVGDVRLAPHSFFVISTYGKWGFFIIWAWGPLVDILPIAVTSSQEGAIAASLFSDMILWLNIVSLQITMAAKMFTLLLSMTCAMTVYSSKIPLVR